MAKVLLVRFQNFFSLTRKKLSAFILLSSLIPLFFCTTYTFFLLESAYAKKTVLFTLIGAFSTALVVLWLLRVWESKMKRAARRLLEAKIKELQEAPLESHQKEILRLQTMLADVQKGYEHQIDLLQTSVTKSKTRIDELTHGMEQKLEEMRVAYLEFEDLRKEYSRLEDEYQRLQEDATHRLRHKEGLIAEYQHTIQEQRAVIEKKQRYIGRLEGKVKDLMYEIRSLLHLEEAPPDANIPLDLVDQDEKTIAEMYLPSPDRSHSTTFDLSTQLERYIGIAQKFTGADHLGYVGGKGPRFSDSSSYAIDLRRLFDSFRDETTGLLLIYSPLEQKLLFVNNFVKHLLGWPPEKFLKDFSQLVEMGYKEWGDAIERLSSVREAQTKLVIRGKNGDKILFTCTMGVIYQGPFTNHVVMLCAPTR